MKQTSTMSAAGAIRGAVAVLGLITLVVLAFAPGIDGPFVFDDYSNMLREPTMQALHRHQASLGDVIRAANAGPLGRPLSVATLGLQVEFGGFVPRPFKIFNIGVHALNAVLVFLLTRLLLAQPGAAPRSLARIDLLALLAACLWGLHPLTLTSVLYVVQRMTSLAATGVLCALLCAAQGRLQLARGARAWPWLWLGFPLAATAAVLAKESGVLVLPYLLVLELTVLSPVPLPPAAAAPWRRFVFLFAWVPLLAALLALPFLVAHFAPGYGRREFSLFERLLTEPRVIWFYLRMLLLPDPRVLGLYHDDLAISTGWFTPWTTLPALLGLAGTGLAAILLRRRQPWLALAVLFFLASQLIESTFIPLEIAHEHRVYLGMLGPIIAAAVGLTALAERSRIRHAHWLLAVPVLLLWLSTWQRSTDWSAPLRFALIEADHHPGSVRARYDVATVYAELGEASAASVDRARLFGLARESALQSIALAPRDPEPRIGLLVICGLAGCRPPEATVSELIRILASDHRTDQMASQLDGLAACAADGSCGQWRALWLRLCAALLANPGLGEGARRTLAAHLDLPDVATGAADAGHEAGRAVSGGPP